MTINRTSTTVRRSGGALFFAAALALSACGSDAAPIAVAAADTTADAAAAAPEAEATESAALVGTASSDLGDILVDANGLSLYGFLDDTEGLPTCDGACADAWPPVFTDSAELPAGLDASVFSVVERNDGSFQLKAGAWPLYLFAGDGAPGDVNGQGSGDVWFLSAPDGSLIGTEGAMAAMDDAMEEEAAEESDY
jgi:predicted lipoprotein with Yx(FWY)xxD motif